MSTIEEDLRDYFAALPDDPPAEVRLIRLVESAADAPAPRGRRAWTGRSAVVATSAVAALAVAVAISVPVRHATDHTGNGPVSPGTETVSNPPGGSPVYGAPITIAHDVDEYFTPITANPPDGILSAQEAWSRWLTHSHAPQRPIPASITVRLGRLTLARTADNQLSYGYSEPSGCLTTLPSATPASHCVEWTFLDAHTGREIDQTWQETPAHK